MSRERVRFAAALAVAAAVLAVGATPVAGATPAVDATDVDATGIDAAGVDESPVGGPGGAASGVPAAEDPAGTTGNGVAAAGGAAAATEPFVLRQQNVTRCGLTCRAVAVTLTNVGEDTAENITVRSRILAGGEVVETRRATVRRLRPNETVSRTIRIDVGLRDLVTIRNNGGRIAIQSTIESDRHNVTKTNSRKIL